MLVVCNGYKIATVYNKSRGKHMLFSPLLYTKFISEMVYCTKRESTVKEVVC